MVVIVQKFIFFLLGHPGSPYLLRRLALRYNPRVPSGKAARDGWGSLAPPLNVLVST
jgi:hypothetical protein